MEKNNKKLLANSILVAIIMLVGIFSFLIVSVRTTAIMQGVVKPEIVESVVMQTPEPITTETTTGRLSQPKTIVVEPSPEPKCVDESSNGKFEEVARDDRQVKVIIF